VYYTLKISPNSFDASFLFHSELGIDASTAAVLTRALSTDEVSDASWLSSSFIDLVLNRFAR
jgi:hypothetical protein